MVPTGVSFWIRDEFERGGIKIQVGSIGDAIINSLHVDLRWDDEQHAEYNRDHQSLETLGDEISTAAFLQHEKTDGARDEKQ